MDPVLIFWLAQVGARALAWVLPRWQARNDQRLIREDGARDSLKDTFHRQKLTLRVGLLLAAGAVAYLPAWGHGYGWGLLAFTAAALALFGHVFNPRLNVARGLDRWYVSLDPKAARFDRALVAMARSQLDHERAPLPISPAEVRARAGLLLERLTRWAVVATVPLDLLALLLIGTRFS